LLAETLHRWLRFARKVNFSLLFVDYIPCYYGFLHLLILFLSFSLSHWTWIENFQSFHLINRESFPSPLYCWGIHFFYGQILLFSPVIKNYNYQQWIFSLKQLFLLPLLLFFALISHCWLFTEELCFRYLRHLLYLSESSGWRGKGEVQKFL
jgi:hypothetical protein